MTKGTIDALLASARATEGEAKFGGNVELALAIERLKLLRLSSR